MIVIDIANKAKNILKIALNIEMACKLLSKEEIEKVEELNALKNILHEIYK